MSLTPAQIRRIYDTIAPMLDEIRPLFRKPKLTLIIRAPDLADGDIVLTDDDDVEAICASVRKTRIPEKKVTPT